MHYGIMDQAYVFLPRPHYGIDKFNTFQTSKIIFALIMYLFNLTVSKLSIWITKS